MLEVIYRRKDGILVKSVAFYSYRRGPIGEWEVGSVPLDKIDGEVLSTRPFDVSRCFVDWASEFRQAT